MQARFGTKQQREATTPHESFWVSANAGTGKTKVLVDRIISLLVSDIKPSKILCITFTKAGAAEMISRITNESNKLLALEETKLCEYIEGNCNISVKADKIRKIRKTLTSIIDNPDLIRIQTIHSFCGTILKAFPLEAGVVPFFNTADDVQTSEITEKAWGNFIKAMEIGQGVYFSAYCDLSSLYGFDTIRKTVFSLFEKKAHIDNVLNVKGGLAEYLEYLKNSFEVDLSVNPENEFFELYKNDIEKLAYCLRSGKTNAIRRADKLFSIIKKFSFSRLNELFFENEKVKELSDKDSEKKFPEVKELVETLRASIKIWSDRILSYRLLTNTKNYLILLTGFKAYYELEKDRNYFLDYNDLIEKSKNLLTNSEFASWVLYKLDGGIEHILVDEAQDTSPSQWEIIRAITEEFFSGDAIKTVRTIFVVGDEKQSIFSFQGADLKIFSDMKTFFDLKIGESSETDKILNKIPLSSSFRSLSAILELVDEILQEETVKKATMTDVVNHQANRLKHYGYIEIQQLIPQAKTVYNNEPILWYLPEEYEENDEGKKKAILAKNIADKINKIINEVHILPRTNAQARAGDIMILMRKRDKELVAYITAELQKRNISTSGIDKLDITGNMAILDILACAKFLLQKNDDYNLACLLKSPFICLSEDDIFYLCYNRKGKSLYEFLLENELRFSDAVNFLNLLERIKFTSIRELFFKILDVLGFRKNLVATFGSSIDEIINEFLSITENFESKNLANLQIFIKWFEKNGGEIKRDQDMVTDEVRIMTIHAAKGLEAPVVILADTTSSTLEERSFVLDDNYILVPGSKDCNNGFSKGKFEEHRNKDQQERFRLLYVALTRACDELYVFGLENNKNKNSWYEFIKSAALRLPKSKTEEGVITVTDEQYLQFISDNQNLSAAKAIVNSSLPKFFFEDYKEEQTENSILPSLLSSGSYNSDEKKVINISKHDLDRGTIIHRLLEVLPNYSEDKKENVFKIIIDEYGVDDEVILEEIKSEVFSIMSSEELRFLYSGNSKAEVAISGYIDDSFVNGKIDRLIFDGDVIHLVDYKTHKNPEGREDKLIEDYRPQMHLYYRLLKNIYPDKKIMPKLLLTKTGKFLNYNFDN